MKAPISTFLMLFVLVILLFGCASSENSSSSQADTSPEQSQSLSAEQNEDVQSFFEGERITLIVPYDPGAGYDIYARMLAPYLEEYTGATVVISNLPGAGGLRGVNELYSAPSDGLTIGIMNGSAMVANQIAEMNGVRYDLNQFSYLGRMVSDIRVLTMAVDSPYQAFDDLLGTEKPILLGATGLGGSTYVDAVVVSEALGLNVSVMHGYDSVVEPAILRGEVEGTWGSLDSRRISIEDGVTIPVLQSGTQRSEDLSDVPTAMEMVDKAKDPERAASILEVWDALSAVGRPLAAPPGLPEDRLAFLQEAFDRAMADERFIEDAKQSQRDLLYASGTEMLEIAKAATNIQDEEVKQIIINAITGEL